MIGTVSTELSDIEVDTNWDDKVELYTSPSIVNVHTMTAKQALELAAYLTAAAAKVMNA